MKFSTAMEHILDGKMLTRGVWEPDSYVYMNPGSRSAQSEAEKRIFSDVGGVPEKFFRPQFGDTVTKMPSISYHDGLYGYTSNGWTPATEDMFALDWEVKNPR